MDVVPSVVQAGGKLQDTHLSTNKSRKGYRASAQVKKCCRKGLSEHSDGVQMVPGAGEAWAELHAQSGVGTGRAQEPA